MRKHARIRLQTRCISTKAWHNNIRAKANTRTFRNRFPLPAILALWFFRTVFCLRPPMQISRPIVIIFSSIFIPYLSHLMLSKCLFSSGPIVLFWPSLRLYKHVDSSSILQTFNPKMLKLLSQHPQNGKERDCGSIEGGGEMRMEQGATQVSFHPHSQQPLAVAFCLLRLHIVRRKVFAPFTVAQKSSFWPRAGKRNTNIEITQSRVPPCNTQKHKAKSILWYEYSPRAAYSITEASSSNKRKIKARETFKLTHDLIMWAIAVI